MLDINFREGLFREPHTLFCAGEAPAGAPRGLITLTEVELYAGNAM